MSPEPNLPFTPSAGAATAPAVAPLSSRAAGAIFGTMVLLIIALTVVLVQTTRGSVETSVESPAPLLDHYPSTDLARH